MKKRNLLTKVLAMALVLMLATGLFAGCGKEEQPAEQQPTGAKPEEQKPEEQAQSKPEWGGLTLPIVDKPITIEFWMPMSPKRATTCKDMSEMPPVQELEKRTGINIKWINPPQQQAVEQFNLMMASQDLPDVIYTSWTDPVRYAQDGAIVPLNDLLKENAPNYNKLMKQFPDMAKQLTSDDGKMYYMGLLRTPWGGVNPSVSTLPRMVIRQDWLNKVGKKVPTTLDEWYDVLKAFKAAGDLDGNGKADEIPFTANRFALGNGAGDTSIQAALIRPYGIIPGFYQIDGKVYFGALQPEYKEAVTMIRKWYSEGLIDHDFLIHDINQLDAKIYNGQVGALYALSTRWFKKANDMFAEKDPNVKYILAPFPKPVDGNSKVYNFETQTVQYMVGGQGAAITATNKYPKETVKLLDYLYSPEGMVLENFGIEGVSYKIENGIYIPTFEEVAKAEGITPEAAYGKYQLAYAEWPFSALPPNGDEWYKTSGLPAQAPPPELDPIWQGMAKYGWTYEWSIEDAKTWDTSRILPPVSFTPEESKQVTTKMTEIDTYVTDMFAKFVTGQEPLTKFDDFTAQLKNMGIEDVLKIYQAALDRYNKR